MKDIVRIIETHSRATPFPDMTELPAHLPLPLSVYCQQEAKSLSPINYHKKCENKMLREFKKVEAVFIGEDKGHDLEVKRQAEFGFLEKTGTYLILEEDGRGYQDEKLK